MRELVLEYDNYKTVHNVPARMLYARVHSCDETRRLDNSTRRLQSKAPAVNGAHLTQLL